MCHCSFSLHANSYASAYLAYAYAYSCVAAVKTRINYILRLTLNSKKPLG